MVYPKRINNKHLSLYGGILCWREVFSLGNGRTAVNSIARWPERYLLYLKTEHRMFEV